MKLSSAPPILKHGGGRAWNPPFPGGRVPLRPSLVQPHADFIKDVPMHGGVRLIARKRVIYWH